MIPNKMVKDNIKLLSSSFNLPKRLPIVPRYIYLIRFIISNRILDIFGEKFPMPKRVEYEYFWATIDTAQEIFFTYNDSKLVVK